MNYLKLLLFFGITLLASCKSNSLKQAHAEKAIREFLSTNKIETSKGIISAEAIQKIGKTNIFSQFSTSVKVHFRNTEGQPGLKLLFIFTRTARNKWFLKSVEALDETPQELTNWLTINRRLNIPVN